VLTRKFRVIRNHYVTSTQPPIHSTPLPPNCLIVLIRIRKKMRIHGSGSKRQNINQKRKNKCSTLKTQIYWKKRIIKISLFLNGSSSFWNFRNYLFFALSISFSLSPVPCWVNCSAVSAAALNDEFLKSWCWTRWLNRWTRSESLRSAGVVNTEWLSRISSWPKPGIQDSRIGRTVTDFFFLIRTWTKFNVFELGH